MAMSSPGARPVFSMASTGPFGLNLALGLFYALATFPHTNVVVALLIATLTCPFCAA